MTTAQIEADPVRGTRHRFSTGLILIGTSLVYLGVTLAIPVLPVYLRDHLHAGAGDTGLVMGAPAISSVIARPLTGMFADRYGARRAFVLGALLVAVTSAAYSLCTGTAALAADRLILGLGQGATLAAATVWVVDLAPAEGRGRAIGLVGLVNYLVLAVGAAAGPAVLALDGGYTAVWILVALLPAVGGLLGAAGVRPERVPVTRGVVDGTSTRWWLSAGPILSPGLSLALSFVGYATLTSFTVLALDERDISHGGLVLSAYAMAVASARLILGSLPDRLGEIRTLAMACATEAVGISMIGLAPTLTVAVIGGAVTGIGMSLVYPALGLQVLRATDGLPRRQTLIASFGAFVDIGIGVGAPLIGVIAATGGYRAAFGATALLAVVAFVMQAMTAPGRRR